MNDPCPTTPTSAPAAPPAAAAAGPGLATPHRPRDHGWLATDASSHWHLPVPMRNR